MEEIPSPYAKLEEGHEPVVAVAVDPVVIYAQPVQNEPTAQSYAVWDNQQDITLLALPQQREEEDYCCAQVGCLLSWIPIVGFITFCANCDASHTTKRRHFANMACWIASSIVIVQVIVLLATS